MNQSVHTQVSTGLTSAHIPDPFYRRLGLDALCLNGPDFGPYSGRPIDMGSLSAPNVSTGLTSAHIPDPRELLMRVWNSSLNGPDFGPYSGPLSICVANTAQKSQRA